MESRARVTANLQLSMLDSQHPMTDPQQDLLPPDNAELSALLDHAILIDSRVWPRVLSDLVDVCADHFRRNGSDATDALTQAKRVIIALSHYFGGRMLYIPQQDKLAAALRDAEIWRNPDRLTVRELAARYDLTAAQIYNILAEQRAINRARALTRAGQD